MLAASASAMALTGMLRVRSKVMQSSGTAS
jgi:hypothetical protein